MVLLPVIQYLLRIHPRYASYVCAVHYFLTFAAHIKIAHVLCNITV